MGIDNDAVDFTFECTKLSKIIYLTKNFLVSENMAEEMYDVGKLIVLSINRKKAYMINYWKSLIKTI
ncbi:MAG: hypothetical protein K2N34_03480 [Lachnospiraceae bacterium]|nr:hypothetical protein [Lachnospiraceae bacterium]